MDAARPALMAVLVAALVGGCAPSSIDRVRMFQEAWASGDNAGAGAILSPDARIWFETREGPGEPLRVGGPWAQWDREFRSRNTYAGYTAEGRHVTVETTETNDFYRLIERAPTRAKVTYTLNEQGRVAEVLYVPIKDARRPPDRLPAFKAWARANAAEEFERVAPGGRIVPGGDEARSWRALLVRWRRQTGLPPVE